MNFKISKQMFNGAYLPHLNNYSNRFEIYYGGAGSGKSHFVTQKLLLKYLKEANRKCLVIRKVGNTLRDSVFALFKTIIGDWQLYDQCKINKTDMTIELPNGSQFIFKGMDEPEKIKSIAGIDDIWVEECTEVNDFDFDQLSLRLRSNKPHNQLFCSFNPISKSNWVYKRWFSSDAWYDKGNTVVLHTTYRDNKFLPKEYIENLNNMKNTNPAYYAIYAEGQFASTDKLVYTNWEEKYFDYKEILNKKKKSKALFGLDFGYTNDPTAFVGVIVDEIEKEIYIFDEFQEKGLTNEKIAKRVEDMGYRKEVISCDSAEPKSIDELKQNGLNRARPAIKGRDSIMNGIQLVQQFKIYIHPKCRDTLEEFKNYTWIKDRKTGEYINKPIDSFNHSLDALRYAIQTEIKGFVPPMKFLSFGGEKERLLTRLKRERSEIDG